MVYATETVLALHRARMADERRARRRRDTQERRALPGQRRSRLRPAAATR